MRIAGVKLLGVVATLVSLLMTTAASSAVRVGAGVPLILLVSSRTPTGSLLAATPNGSGVRDLSTGVVDSISPDGRWVIVEQGAGPYQLLGTDGRTLRVPPEQPSVLYGSWSPDSTRFAYIDKEVLRIVDLHWKTLFRLTGFVDQPPVWSPDGRHLAVEGALLNSTNRSRALEIVDLSTGTARTVATDAGGLPSIGWSPNGEMLAYQTAASPAAVDLLDVTSGQSDVLTAAAPGEFVTSTSWSPDGQMLVLEGYAGGGEVFDAGGHHVASLPSGTNWRWARDGRLTYIGSAGIVALDVRSGSSSILVPATGGRKIEGFEWSPDGSELAFEQERFPGVGSDVFVLDAAGQALRTTSPYPDGGDNQLVGWVSARAPGAPPVPAHVRTVEPTPAAQLPVAAWLFQGGRRPVYASLPPEDDPQGTGIGCGRLVVGRTGAFDPCVGANHPLLEAAATSTQVAWVIEHEDEGIGDEDGACAYLLPLAELAHPPPLDGCWPGVKRKSAAEIASITNDTIDVRAAGDTLLTDAARIVAWTGRGRRLLTPSAGGLLDADASRVLVRRGDELRVLDLDGRVLFRLPLGTGFRDAALDGDGVVVLRPNAIEEYTTTGKRAARLPIIRGLGGYPVLCGASDGIAAYLEGIVLHVVRFRDGLDIPLRFPDAAPPFTAALVGQTLTVAYQREGQRKAGFVGTIALSKILG